VTIIERPSPNHDSRGAGTPIDMLVLHYTGMKTGAEAIARLCDPAAKVSAHYVIEEDGRVFRLVGEDRRAWHAGVSCWRGARDINARAIGIEIVNPGHEFGYRDAMSSAIRMWRPRARKTPASASIGAGSRRMASAYGPAAAKQPSPPTRPRPGDC
jgi:N-acetyl-anhydromuramyl-L-alanine amidase AmpD